MENISELFDQEARLYTGENAEKEIETVAQIQKLELAVRNDQLEMSQKLYNDFKRKKLSREKIYDFIAEWRALEVIRMSVGAASDRKSLFDKEKLDMDSLEDAAAVESDEQLVDIAKHLVDNVSDVMKGASKRKVAHVTAETEEPEQSEDRTN